MFSHLMFQNLFLNSTIFHSIILTSQFSMYQHFTIIKEEIKSACNYVITKYMFLNKNPEIVVDCDYCISSSTEHLWYQA